MLKTAIFITILPPMIWFTLKAIERPFHIVLLTLISYSLLGHYRILDKITLFQGYVSIGFLVFLIYLAAGQRFTISRQFVLHMLFPMTFLLVLGAFSMRMAKDLHMSLEGLRIYAGGILFSFLVYQFTQNQKDIKTYIKVVVVILLLSAGLGILQLTGDKHFFVSEYYAPAYTGDWSQFWMKRRPTGFYSNPTNQSQILLFAVMPVLALVIMGWRTRWRTVLIIALTMGVIAIATCQERYAQISFLVGMVYIMFRTRQLSQSKRIVFIRSSLVLILTCAIFGLFLYLNPSVMRRYNAMSYSTFLRLFYYSMSFDILKDNWLWGIGFGNFKAVYFEYLPSIFNDFAPLASAQGPGNEFLDIWVGAGIFAVIAYVALFVFTFIAFDHVRRFSQNEFMVVVSVGFQAYLFCVFFLCMFHKTNFDNTFSLMIGLSYAMLAITRKPAPSAHRKHSRIPPP